MACTCKAVKKKRMKAIRKKGSEDRANRRNERKLKRAERKGPYSDTTRKDQKEEKKANRQNRKALRKAVRKSAY